LYLSKDPSVNCEILHEQTGTPIAQVSPLIIACFEGDIDIIRFFIEVRKGKQICGILFFYI
jgi:hypothetical protein